MDRATFQVPSTALAVIFPIQGLHTLAELVLLSAAVLLDSGFKLSERVVIEADATQVIDKGLRVPDSHVLRGLLGENPCPSQRYSARRG